MNLVVHCLHLVMAEKFRVNTSPTMVVLSLRQTTLVGAPFGQHHSYCYSTISPTSKKKTGQMSPCTIFASLASAL